MKEIGLLVQAIKNDKIHGASYLADRAMQIIQNAVQTSQTSDREDFLEEIYGLARELINCRPAMVPIRNCISRFIAEVIESSQYISDLDSLRCFALSGVQNIIIACKQARDNTIESGASLIDANDTIMTCSFSSTIVQTLACAQRQGRSFQVLAARSQASPRDIAYGETTAAALKPYNIDCRVFADEYIRENILKADKIIAGADSVLPDGSLWNGCPTAKVALAAYEQAVPFYSICDTSKFCSDDIPELAEEGFDLVSSRLVTGIVCETGLIKPDQVRKLIKQYHFPSNFS